MYEESFGGDNNITFYISKNVSIARYIFVLTHNAPPYSTHPYPSLYPAVQ